jgi:predicted nucleic acid-binding protein
MDKVGITSIVSEDEELDAVKGIRHVWLDTTGQGIRGA